MRNLRGILCLGRIAHDSVVKTLGEKQKARPFGHGAAHEIGGLTLYDTTIARATTPILRF